MEISTQIIRGRLVITTPYGMLHAYEFSDVPGKWTACWDDEIYSNDIDRRHIIDDIYWLLKEREEKTFLQERIGDGRLIDFAHPGFESWHLGKGICRSHHYPKHDSFYFGHEFFNWFNSQTTQERIIYMKGNFLGPFFFNIYCHALSIEMVMDYKPPSLAIASPIPYRSIVVRCDRVEMDGKECIVYPSNTTRVKSEIKRVESALGIVKCLC